MTLVDKDDMKIGHHYLIYEWDSQYCDYKYISIFELTSSCGNGIISVIQRWTSWNDNRTHVVHIDDGEKFLRVDDTGGISRIILKLTFEEYLAHIVLESI